MGMYEELVNRRIQLKSAGDPNLNAGLDGALVGTTLLQTDSGPPMVIWRKNRAGSSGWDLEVISPQQYPATVYVNSNNTSPLQDGSITNPYKTIQAALDAMGPAVDYDDFVLQRQIYVFSGTYVESPVIPAARPVSILLEGNTWIQGYITIAVDQTLLPVGITTGPYVSIVGMALSTRGGTFSVTPSVNGIQYSIVNVYTWGCALQVYGVDVWEIIDASVNPGGAAERHKILVDNAYIGGKDIGGGIWKAIYAPYSDVYNVVESTLSAELDAYSFFKIKGSSLYNLQVRNRWYPFWSSGDTGIIESDFMGIITTPVSTTVRCLPCDKYSMRMFDLYMRYGYVTVNLAHVFEFDGMWCNEITVNTGSAVVLDSFLLTAGKSCEWSVELYRGSPATQIRMSRIGAVWTSAGSINSQGEIVFGDIGDTSSITLSVDVSGGTTVRLLATTTVTSAWKVRVQRNITHAYNAGL